MSARRAVITGITGFIGGALAQALRGTGWEVLGIGRGTEAAIRWDPAAGVLDPAPLEGCDAVVHLAGEGVASGPWTASRKAAIRNSRVDSTALLARTLAGLKRPPAVFVSASAIGYYGDRGDEVLTEESPPGTGFLAEVGRDWEAAAQPAVEAGIRVAHPRFGIVLGPGGGALEKMLPPFRAGLGGVFGSGRQWMSWIALEDTVAALRLLLDRPDLSGPFNLVGPQPATNREFTATLNRVVGRPGFLPVPAFAVKLLFGEMGEATLLGSQRALPRRLRDAGFNFRLSELEAALRAAAG